MITANDRLLHFMARLPLRLPPSLLLSRTISPQPCILPGKNLKEGGLSKFFALVLESGGVCLYEIIQRNDRGV